ncbi:hypothetical protein [Bartonella queenslandensis]|uniref:hypothetical protein n=1 Tax=Bartonella queenslandensis TaxID=481138 RepID=UPI001BAC8CED|nr:hypothetical protein [Bartonella queenslandensis]
MKIFKHCISCVVAVAIFFSQILGANADSLNGRFQNDDFISVMKEENGVIKTVKAIISQISGQSGERDVQKVAGLIGMEAAIFGLIAYLAYFFSRKPPTHHQKPGERAFTAFARSAWALN